MNKEQVTYNPICNEEQIFQINTLPFGVVRDMIDLLIDTNGDFDTLINPSVIRRLYKQGKIDRKSVV